MAKLLKTQGMQARREGEERRPAILRKKTSHQSPPSGSVGSGSPGGGAGAAFSARFLFLAPLTGAMDAEEIKESGPRTRRLGALRWSVPKNKVFWGRVYLQL
jgi:hypothetical protein